MSGAPRLRVGVLGLGYAGATHVEAFSQHPGCDVVALAGLEQDRLQAIADQAGIEHTHRRWEDLVARDDLDVVSVGLPNALHEPAAVAALDRGKHVLCEKPLARVAAEAERMVAAAEANDRVLHTAFNHRHRGDVGLLRPVVAAGRLGQVYLARAWWRRAAAIPAGTWFTSRHLAGGGPLIDLGVHVLDMALHLLGEPTATSAAATTSDALGGRGIGTRTTGAYGDGAGAFGVEDTANALVRLSTGATLVLDVAWASHLAPRNDFGVELHGTDGAACIRVTDQLADDTLRIVTAAGEERPAVPPPGGHAAVVRELVDAIAGRSWAAHRGHRGLERSRIVDACYRSARSGREEPVA